jgi:hypothetical protein
VNVVGADVARDCVRAGLRRVLVVGSSMPMNDVP